MPGMAGIMGRIRIGVTRGIIRLRAHHRPGSVLCALPPSYVARCVPGGITLPEGHLAPGGGAGIGTCRADLGLVLSTTTTALPPWVRGWAMAYPNLYVVSPL